MIDENELVKAVFSNPNGDKLMDFWEEMLGDQMSYIAGNTPEQTAFNEGKRSFYLALKFMLKQP